MSTRTRSVRTSDGIDLHVEVDDGPQPTVVLMHGFTARLEEFLLQRETLRGRARVVLYDCRYHGRSRPRGRVRTTSMDQLGLGHSMGGMTIMALARQRPELFGDSDRLTPVSHSRRMAQALPDAELVVVPGAGHSVNVPGQEVVDGALLRLLERVQQQQAA